MTMGEDIKGLLRAQQVDFTFAQFVHEMLLKQALI